jgi:hypothetical protein
VDKAVVCLHVLLLILEDLPWWGVLFGLASHLLYFQMLANYPFLELTDPVFIGSCGMPSLRSVEQLMIIILCSSSGSDVTLHVVHLL